jgi:dihydroflavonol-4-reductase
VLQDDRRSRQVSFESGSQSTDRRPPTVNVLVGVTGVSGFVGSAIVRELLEHGYRVRGTARSPDRAIGHLGALPGAAERLEVVAADLDQPRSFDAALAGCDFVIHAASPYVLTVKNPQRDLVDPAVQGTLAVLSSARISGTVKRVVVTSSFAAVTDEPEGTFDETHWNATSSVTRNPYYFSKVAAERAAWDFVASQPGFELVVINPSLIIGPSLVPSMSVSNQLLADFTTTNYPGILDLAWGLVDVRDVGAAHRLALEIPSASGRYLCVGDVWTMRQIVEFARQSDLGLRLPSLPLDNAIGRALVRLGSTFQPSGNRDFIRTNLGRRFQIDTTRIRTELGMEFRSVGESILDTYRDLRGWGHITV